MSNIHTGDEFLSYGSSTQHKWTSIPLPPVCMHHKLLTYLYMLRGFLKIIPVRGPLCYL